MAVSNTMLSCVMMLSVFSGVAVADDNPISTYYLSNYCGSTLDMDARNKDEIQIELSDNGYHNIFMDCDMTIVTKPHHSLLFAFQYVSLLSCGDSVAVYGFNTSDVLSPRICIKPTDNYITSGSVGIVNFKSDWFGFEGKFRILVTSFYFTGNGDCNPNYFKCDNDHCINSELVCNKRNNCGDDSDNDDDDCGYNTWWIILVSCLCAGALIVIVVVVVAICLHNHSQRKVQTMGGRVISTNTAQPQVHATSFPNQTFHQGSSGTATMGTTQQTGSTLPASQHLHPNQSLPQNYSGTTTLANAERSPATPQPVMPPVLNSPVAENPDDYYSNVPAPAVYIDPNLQNTKY